MRTDTNSGYLELREKELSPGTKISIFSREKSKIKFQFYETFLNREVFYVAHISYQSRKRIVMEQGVHLTWIKGNRWLCPELFYFKSVLIYY